MEANFSGYNQRFLGGTAVSVGAQTKFVEGICRVGWRLFAVCARGLHCACTPGAQTLLGGDVAVGRAGAGSNDNPTRVPFTVLPQDGLGGGYAAAFAQGVNFLLKGV